MYPKESRYWTGVVFFTSRVIDSLSSLAFLIFIRISWRELFGWYDENYLGPMNEWLEFKCRCRQHLYMLNDHHYWLVLPTISAVCRSNRSETLYNSVKPSKVKRKVRPMARRQVTKDIENVWQFWEDEKKTKLNRHEQSTAIKAMLNLNKCGWI